MRLLLDTHILLWALDTPARLDRGTRALIEDPANEVLFSAASIWEIAIKAELGKLQVPDDLPQRVSEAGLEWTDLRPEHAWAVRAVTGLPHRDPFDRALVAQAASEGLDLLTADEALLSAELAPDVRRLDARA